MWIKPRNFTLHPVVIGEKESLKLELIDSKGKASYEPPNNMCSYKWKKTCTSQVNGKASKVSLTAKEHSNWIGCHDSWESQHATELKIDTMIKCYTDNKCTWRACRKEIEKFVHNLFMGNYGVNIAIYNDLILSYMSFLYMNVWADSQNSKLTYLVRPYLSNEGHQMLSSQCLKIKLLRNRNLCRFH